MLSKILIFLVVASLVPQAYATRIYKIVDEEGNVTYSQVPPRKSEESNPQVEALNVQTGAMTRVTVAHGREYCGDIRLPAQADYRGSSSRSFTGNVTSQLESWRQSLDRISESRGRQSPNRYTPNNATYQNQRTARYQEQFTNDTQRMRDLRCAINWAESKQGLIADHKQANQEEMTRLQGVAQQLEARIDRKCGEQPEFDPADQTNEYRRRQWYNCSRDLMRDLNKVRQRMDYL